MTSPSWLVARREVVQRVRRRSFLIFTTLLVVIVIAGGVLAAVLGNDSTTTSYDIGLVSAAGTGTVTSPGTGTGTSTGTDEFAAVLVGVGEASDISVEASPFASYAAAADALHANDIDVVIDIDARRATWQRGVDGSLAALVDTAWQARAAADAARAAGLDTDQLAAILTPDPLLTAVVDPSDDDLVGVLVGFASAMLLFISIATFGGYVLTGVVEEKSTGVIEVLLSHVRADQLMAGKVFGIGAVALLQFAATAAAGMVSLWISGIDVPSEI
jgi:ABC-2 type transport system permease protein